MKNDINTLCDENSFMECPNCGNKIKLYEDLEFENVLIGECKNCKNRYATEKIKNKEE